MYESLHLIRRFPRRKGFSLLVSGFGMELGLELSGDNNLTSGDILALFLFR